jgi:hypothetical protein
MLILGLAGLGLSCSRTEPRIVYGHIEMVYYEAPGTPEERFSFFVIPEDDDGLTNLEEMYLYHDLEGLRWNIGPEDWETYESEGTAWIGSRGIAMPDGEALPRGQYRAVLVNKGGEKTERSFTFDAPRDPRFPFPFLSISEGIYRIDSAYPENRFICYDAQGDFVTVLPLDQLDGLVTDLELPANVRGAALWAEDPAYATSALTNVVSLR